LKVKIKLCVKNVVFPFGVIELLCLCRSSFGAKLSLAPFRIVRPCCRCKN